MKKILQKQLLTVFLLSSAVAFSADLPKRKSGLWEITPKSTMTKGGDMVMTMCIDQNTDAGLTQQTGPLAQSKCSKQEHKVESGRVTFNSVCNFGKTTITTQGAASGNFDKEYKVETKSTYEPPLRDMKESSTTITAKWLGPCKAGQRPGDMVMPNGMTMNMNDLRKMQKQ